MYLFYMLGGLVAIVYGLNIVIVGKFEHRGVLLVGRVPGIICIICGALGLFVGYRQATSGGKPRENARYLACPQCGETYDVHEVAGSVCPICGVSLERLEGFFQRHPKHLNKAGEDNRKK